MYQSLSGRFFAKVRVVESGCHEWQGYITKNGYGQIGNEGRIYYAHRVAWLLNHGDPGDSYVLHKCDNRCCVNPEHLFLGTFQDNMDDMINKKRNAFGTRSGHAKLTEDQVLAIRSSDESLAAQGRRYGVTTVTVWQVKHRTTWKHI